MKAIVCIFLFSLIVFGCTQKQTQKQQIQTVKKTEKSPFLKKFAGTYEVYVKNSGITEDSESYTLYESGLAEWKWFERKSGHIKSLKNGIWSADEKLLKITIEGNSGRISENFKIENGKISNDSRMLRKVKK